MDDGAGTDQGHTLAQAQSTISRQQEEIERLRRRVADERLADDLRDALALAGTAGTIASPVAHARLLEMIVQTAAHVIRARAGALFLIDEEAEELVFEVAIGPKAEEVKKFRVPLGHGIAGYVAVSGQPMAISDAQNDPRQAADIAQSVGYTPHSILCVPLLYEDDVIGVLELLDKEGETGFNTADMEALGLFANQAAVAIEQSRIHRSLSALVGQVIASLVQAEPGAGLQKRSEAFITALEDDQQYRRALDLAQLIHQIAREGDAEHAACRAVLVGFAEYLRSRPVAGGEMELGR